MECFRCTPKLHMRMKVKRSSWKGRLRPPTTFIFALRPSHIRQKSWTLSCRSQFHRIGSFFLILFPQATRQRGAIFSITQLIQMLGRVLNGLMVDLSVSFSSQICHPSIAWVFHGLRSHLSIQLASSSYLIWEYLHPRYTYWTHWYKCNYKNDLFDRSNVHAKSPSVPEV